MATSSPPSPSPSIPPPAPSPPVPKGTSTAVWIVIVIVIAAALGGVGFYAGYEYRGSPASTPSSTQNTTLSVLGAGTLTSFFPQIANQLVNETPGISAPSAAQTYEGSLDVTTAITTLAATTDVAAVADYRLIPSLLEPKFASYEVVFASTPEVLVYNGSISAFNGISTSNWGSKLVSALSTPGVAKMGVWNASTDPNGYNEIFDMMLQGMLYADGNISAVYGHLYSGAPGTYATPNPAVTVLEHESQAANLIKTGVVSCVITYRSFAVANGLTYVPMDPIVGLYANNTTALNDYAKLSTQIIGSNGSLTKVVPAPVLFSATVPLNAPNAALGAAFLHLLISPQGAAILSAGGAFTPIFPAWSDNPKAVPSVLAPDVTSLPPWASNLLPAPS
jgi:molybdate/tungstate transport system substrate-binding protein